MSDIKQNQTVALLLVYVTESIPISVSEPDYIHFKRQAYSENVKFKNACLLKFQIFEIEFCSSGEPLLVF